MKKAKLLIPLVGSIAAVSATVPAMVSCAKAATIDCDAPKTKTLSADSKMLVNCQYTGQLKPFMVEGVNVVAAFIDAFSINEAGEKINDLRVNFYNDETSEAPDNYFPVDEEGKFSFYMAFDEAANYKFELAIHILSDKKLEKFVVDGFDYTVN